MVKVSQIQTCVWIIFCASSKSKNNVLDFSEQHVSFLNLLINEQPCLAFYEYFSTILTWQVRRGQLPPRFWQNRRCHWAVVVLCIKVEKNLEQREVAF